MGRHEEDGRKRGVLTVSVTRSGGGSLPLDDSVASAAPAIEWQTHPAVGGVVVLVRLEEEFLGIDGHPEDEAAAQAADVDYCLS